MQSFVTVLMAACIVCLAMIMMTPNASLQDQRFALQITLEENGEVFSAPQVVVEPGKSYVIDLEAGAETLLRLPGAKFCFAKPVDFSLFACLPNL